MKFGVSIGINESIICANFGDPRSRDHELRHKKTHRKRRVGLENLLICLQLKNHLTCKAEINTQCGCLKNAYADRVLGAPVHMAKVLQAKNGLNVDVFELKYLGNIPY